MTFNDQNRPDSQNPGPQQPGWGIPLAVGAVVIAAAAIIFASAGPDRTRTADVKNQPIEARAPAVPADPPAPRPTARSIPQELADVTEVDHATFEEMERSWHGRVPEASSAAQAA